MGTILPTKRQPQLQSGVCVCVCVCLLLEGTLLTLVQRATNTATETRRGAKISQHVETNRNLCASILRLPGVIQVRKQDLRLLEALEAVLAPPLDAWAAEEPPEACIVRCRLWSWHKTIDVRVVPLLLTRRPNKTSILAVTC